MQKKKAHLPWKKSTKSTPAHQKKKRSKPQKKAQKSTMVLLKALTTIPGLTCINSERQNVSHDSLFKHC